GDNFKGLPITITNLMPLTGHFTEVEKGERKMNLETTNSTFNFGDIIFTLFSLGFIVIIIALIVFVIRTNNKRKHQLDRIEKKVDNLNQQTKSSNK
ncbi:hypothetical protein, partial [Sporosarcina sp. BP05]|uniref:hypothetical protein n=1 Tax=Sporosarcina sp. BP05 TaxID=2758726 RepID=UPI0021066D21